MAIRSSSRVLALLLLAGAFLGLGLLFDRMPSIVESQIKRTVELATNKEMRALWAKPPVDLHSYYWLFAVENAPEFQAGQAPRLKLRKVGPFHFTSRIEKQVGELSPNKHRISYNSTRRIRFNESSVPTALLDEPLALVNPVLLATVSAAGELAHRMEDQQQARVSFVGARKLAERYNETLFLKLSAREILLGRPVPMLTAARRIAQVSGIDFDPAAMLGPDLKFGLVSVQNNSWLGPVEVYTGYQASQAALGQVFSFRGQTRLAHYQGRCSRLGASAGEFRPMPLDERRSADLFLPAFCRVLHLRPTGVRRTQQGPAVAYLLDPTDFASAASNPDNQCFCSNGTLDSYCSLDGVVELGPCSLHAPLLITVRGIRLDPRITASIENPEAELFQSDPEPLPSADAEAHMLILQRVGVPVRVDMTAVVFAKVKRDERVSELRNVPEVSYIPLAMSREIVSIPAQLSETLVNLETFLGLTQRLKVVLYLSALLLVCWLAGSFFEPGPALEPAPASRRRARSRTGSSARAQPPPAAVLFSQVDVLRGAQQRARGSRVADAETPRPAPRRPLPKQRQALDLAESGRAAAASDSVGVAAAGEAPTAAAAAAAGRRPQPDSADASVEPEERERADAAPDTLEPGGFGAAAAAAAAAAASAAELKEAQRAAPKANGKPAAAQQLARKSLFVKVYTSLARMLGDMRHTIRDAGHLDLGSDDSQDRRLEMLAGKIDNWQRSEEGSPPGGPTPAEADAPKPQPEPARTGTSPERAPAESESEPEGAAAPGPGKPAGRKDSNQSSQTVINSRDGRPAPQPTAAAAGLQQDKQLALEKLERALADPAPR